MNDKIKTEKDPYSCSSLEHWLEHDNWTVKEALILLIDCSPIDAEIEWDEYNYWPDAIDDPKMIKVSLLSYENSFSAPESYFEEESQKKKRLSLLSKPYELIDIKRLWYSGNHPNQRYPIDYYLKWAEEKKIHVPWLDWAKKRGLLKWKSTKEKLSETNVEMTYLNTKHPFFAKELKIAVEAWTELYEKNPPKGTPIGGHKTYIHNWLKEKYPNLSNRAVERITTVINPNPKGGATPT